MCHLINENNIFTNNVYVLIKKKGIEYEVLCGYVSY